MGTRFSRTQASFRTVKIAICGLRLVLLVAMAVAAATMHSQAADAVDGQRLFSSSCAACHGLDGRGGERAPNIAKRRDVQRLSDADLTRTIQEGIPGTGMPAFRSLGKPGIAAVVKYLRVLRAATHKTAN